MEVKLILAALVGYLFGSLPTGYLVPKYVKGIDIRTIGSGNVGATNVRRCMGNKWAFFVAAVDMSKAGVAALLMKYLGYPPMVQAVAGVFGALGHSFPVWLKFKGGKSVATTFGALFVFAPIPCLICGAIWYIIMKITRYVSVASMCSVAVSPLVLSIWGVDKAFIYASAFLALLVVVRHKDNIRRLIEGREHKVGEDRINAPTKM